MKESTKLLMVGLDKRYRRLRAERNAPGSGGNWFAQLTYEVNTRRNIRTALAKTYRIYRKTMPVMLTEMTKILAER